MKNHHTTPNNNNMVNKKTQIIKFKKAPGAPKRFKSAYMFYSEQQHRLIRNSSPNKKVRESHHWYLELLFAIV